VCASKGATVCVVVYGSVLKQIWSREAVVEKQRMRRRMLSMFQAPCSCNPGAPCLVIP